MLQQWMITVGILVAYIVALIIFAVWPASAASSGWRLVLGLGAVPALIGLVMRSRMPESPRWLLRHGKYDEVRKAMATLGVQDVSEDDVRARRGGGGTGRGQQPRVAAPGLDARGAAGADRGQRVLHLPADHRDQRAAVLRPAPARAVLLRRARLAGRHHGGRGGGHPDHDGGQRGRHLPGLPLDRQVRPQAAGHRRLHRDDRLRAGRGAGRGRRCPARCGWSSS